MENVIELKNVTKDYGDFKLDNVSFVVPEGSVCGFIGQNGAGKTTTIKLLLDVIGADSGEILLFGKDIRKGSAKLREDIGVVFDEMGFHEFMTGKDINIMMKNIYKNWDEKVFFDYLKRFSLPSGKKCGDFSRGMRMKLQIAVALSHHAKLLVMDEPTSGLDPIVRNEMLQIFREFVVEDDHTILLSSHITGDLEKLADEVVFINGGKIVLSGNKDDILEKHGLLKCKKSEIAAISEALVVNVQPGTFGVEVLVKDRNLCKKMYPQMVVEPVSLEEIMLFYVNKTLDNSEEKAEEIAGNRDNSR
ncbi:MAG: ABC transporter ATP-binding protein [Lachnospira sp.]